MRELDVGEIPGKDKNIFLYFYGVGCVNCEMMKGVIDSLDKEFQEIKFISINAVQHSGVSKIFKIKYLPTFIICRENKYSVIGKGIVSRVELKKSLEKFKVRRVI